MTTVEVLVILAAVVVHVRFGEVLDDSNVFGATVVVHGPRDVDRSGSDLRVLPTLVVLGIIV